VHKVWRLSSTVLGDNMVKYVTIPIEEETINLMIEHGWISFKNKQLYLNERGDRELGFAYFDMRKKHGENLHKHGKQTDKKSRKDK